jgi:hypothetical protein
MRMSPPAPINCAITGAKVLNRALHQQYGIIVDEAISAARGPFAVSRVERIRYERTGKMRFDGGVLQFVGANQKMDPDHIEISDDEHLAILWQARSTILSLPPSEAGYQR